MLFFTFLSRHKLAGRFVLRSRRCLRLWHYFLLLLRTNSAIPKQLDC